MAKDPDEHLDNFLGISKNTIDAEPLGLPSPNATFTINTEKSHEQEDYELARQTFRTVLEVGSKAVSDLAVLAAADERARTYEVLGKLMRDMAETAKDLYGHQKVAMEVRGIANTKAIHSTSINVEKAVFVGTPVERLRRAKQKKEEKDIEDAEIIDDTPGVQE